MGGGGVVRPCLFLTSVAPINQLRTIASTGPLLLLLFLLVGCIVGLLTRAGFSPSYKANPARILHSSPIGYWVNQ
jgi:hypothetical protein